MCGKILGVRCLANVTSWNFPREKSQLLAILYIFSRQVVPWTDVTKVTEGLQDVWEDDDEACPG